MRNHILTLALISAVIMIVGCGGGGGNGGGPKQDITVSLSPKTISVAGDADQQFMATILNPNNTGVTWTLNGSGCTGSACGTLGNYGGNNNQGWTATYTAPLTVPTPPTVTVTATSKDDATKSDTATITITAPVVTVSVTPATPMVILGATQQLTATVKGTTNKAVTWTTSGPGTIDSSGLYSTPATLNTPKTVTVTATSQADSTKSGSATITIPAVTVAVLPHASTVILGASQQFTATVTNATNTAVTWSLSGPGSVSTSGLYTAPATLTTPATATVTATSQADPNKTMSITFSIPAVAVAVTPSTASLIGGATQQFTAAVANATNQAVTWRVTGSGSTNTSGLYSAPAVVAGPETVTVTATSVADPTKSGTAAVTLIPISVTVSPATAMVVITGKKQFSAAVAGTTNAVVTWSVSGTGCSGDACGTINNVGHYVAPAVVPSSSVTVKATSVADSTKSGTVSVQIMPNGNFKLNGNYVMYFQGFDPTGNMLASVGSVVADGAGNLQGGVYDQNGVSVTPGPHTMSGTYTVSPDNRGILTRSTSQVFRFAIDDAGDRGYFIAFDNSGVRGSGVFKKQTTTDFSLAKITGDYAFGITGSGATGERQGIVGRFTMNGAGSLTQGAFDSVAAIDGHTRIDSFTGAMAMSASTGGPSNGRGTMTLNIPGSGTVNAVFYMVNAAELFYISSDPVNSNAPLLTGTMLAQSPPPFMTSSMNGPAVFHVTGVHASMGNNNIMIGQWVANPTAATLTAEYAGNDSGNSIPLGNFTASYSIAVNGRASLLPSTGGIPTFYSYMVGPNKAFLVSSDQNVMTGMVEPQTVPSGGFTNASMLGDYFLGTIDRASTPVIDASGVVNLDGASTWTSMEDASLPSGNYGDQAVSGSYNITSSTTGRGTITVLGGNGIVFYAVSPAKFYNFVLNVPDRIAVNEQQ